MSEQRSSELDLHAVLRIVRRRLWVLLLVPTLAAGAAFATAKAKTPLYRSTADILIARSQAEMAFNVQGGVALNDPNRLLANQIRVIRSQAITDLVRDRLGFDAEIGAVASKVEDVITLSAVDSNPTSAADIVDAYTGVYLDYRRSTSESQNATIQAELRRQIDPAELELQSLDDDIAKLPADQRVEARARQADIRDVLLTNLAARKAQLAQLESAANVEEGGAQQLAPATVPGAPFEPHPVRSGILGLFVGLMLAAGLVFALDYLDNRIRSKDDLERATDGLPAVGLIPILAGWRNHAAAHVVSIEQPTSATAEAYRSLRTAIQFLNMDRSLHTLLVTSPAGSDGKTTTIVNLAVALARAGQRVVVLDCDLRRPRVHQFFGMDPAPGFTSVLVGEVPLGRALRQVPDVPGLSVLPAGTVPPNPSELLFGQQTVDVLTALKKQADVVLIDSPPVLPVSDATVLATLVDGILIVVNANNTQRKQLGRALELLHQVEGNVVGSVLNRAAEQGRYGGYKYSHGYRPYVEDDHGAQRREKVFKRSNRKGDKMNPATGSISPEIEELPLSNGHVEQPRRRPESPVLRKTLGPWT